MQDLEQGKTGSEESEGMQHQKVKEILKKDCAMRLRMILILHLNAQNEITETEDLEVQLLRHSFGVISWRLEEISKKKTSRRLTVYKIHHTKADVDRLYV